MKVRKEDKERFQKEADRLCLTLSGFMKLCAAERTNKILEQQNE